MLTSRGLGRVLGDLAALGYDAQWCVLGAIDAGAPHERKRIWILADSGRGPCFISGGADVPDADAERCARGRIPAGEREALLHASGRGRRDEASTRSDGVVKGGAVADTKRIADLGGRVATDATRAERGSWWHSEPAVGGTSDGLARELDEYGADEN